MPPRSPFDYDVSVSADKARRTRRRGMTGAFGGPERRCDYPGCENHAEYRAPRSPEQLEDYFWFCLEHVREYNSSWNFFANFSEEDLDRQMRADMVWDRPTWRFGEKAPYATAGKHANGMAWKRTGFQDPFEVLGQNATINPGDRQEAAQRRLLPQHERRALDILGVEDSLSKTEIRKAFKALVKGLHPDMNGGARSDEERLREVLWAWDQIRDSRSFRD